MKPADYQNVWWAQIEPDGYINPDRLWMTKKEARLTAKQKQDGWRLATVVITELTEDD